MEYLETDLYKLVRDQSMTLREDQVKNIMIQILEGVNFLHKNFIMHRVNFIFKDYCRT